MERCKRCGELPAIYCDDAQWCHFCGAGSPTETECNTLRAQLAECRAALEYTLQFAEALRIATPEQLTEWLARARAALAKVRS